MQLLLWVATFVVSFYVLFANGQSDGRYRPPPSLIRTTTRLPNNYRRYNEGNRKGGNDGRYNPASDGRYRPNPNDGKYVHIAGKDGPDADQYKGGGGEYTGGGGQYSGSFDRGDAGGAGGKYVGSGDAYGPGGKYAGGGDTYNGGGNRGGTLNAGSASGGGGSASGGGGSALGARGNVLGTSAGASAVGAGGNAAGNGAGNSGTSNIKKPPLIDVRAGAPPDGWKIIRDIKEQSSEGYHYLYETENGILAEEAGNIENLAPDEDGLRSKGFYEYTGDDGVLYRVDYVADNNGFVPVGDHIPKVPPEIQRLLKYLEEQNKL